MDKSQDEKNSECYEEDFEASQEIENTPGEKIEREEYKPNNIFKIEIPLQKKSLQALEKENLRLRSELKMLNDEVTSLINFSNKIDQKKPQNKEKNLNKKRSNSNIKERKLVNYEQEYLRVKALYGKFNDVNFLMNLKNDVKAKETQVAELEKKIGKIKTSIENKRKNLYNYDDKEIPYSKEAHKQLINENIQIIDTINRLDQKMEKYSIFL